MKDEVQIVNVLKVKQNADFCLRCQIQNGPNIRCTVYSIVLMVCIPTFGARCS